MCVCVEKEEEDEDEGRWIMQIQAFVLGLSNAD